jgi:inhibitor of KinA sporulation pathway (predicted exonuclease)
MSKTIILYDTEYTAWEGSQQRRWSEPWEHREIIQIAALRVRLEDGLVEEDCFNCLVRPRLNPQLSDYIHRLTGITQAAVDAHGLPFDAAFSGFNAFCAAGSAPLFSWGDDPGVLRENCDLCQLVFPAYPAGFYDIRDVLEASGVSTASYSSGTVWQALDLRLDSPAHDALNDVRNLLAALQALVARGRLDPLVCFPTFNTREL